MRELISLGVVYLLSSAFVHSQLDSLRIENNVSENLIANVTYRSSIEATKHFPSIKIKFDPISVLKLDAVTDEVIESWNNENQCKYWVNRLQQTIHFEEKSDGEVINSWEYELINVVEDEATYSFRTNLNDSGVNIIFWKDRSMVALIDVDMIFLVSSNEKIKK